MFRFFASLGLLAMLGIPARVPATSNDDLSQIRALEDRFATAYGNKNVDSLMSVYAPGETLFVFDVVAPPSAHVGWDAYREAWTHFFAMFHGPLHFTISDLDVTTSGDVGYSRSLQHVSGIRADGHPYDIVVRVTDVYRKIDGKWLIVQEHVSLPLDRHTFTPLLHANED